MMSDVSESRWAFARSVCNLVVVSALVAFSCLCIAPVAAQIAGGSACSIAHAVEKAELTAGNVDAHVKTQSSDFWVSSSYLDLSPKEKSVPYGHKYIPQKETVTVHIPGSWYYPVYFKSSNPKVATAEWSKDYKPTAIKLTVYGNARGNATITITNSWTYETRKIKVHVGGYDSKDFRASKTKLDLSPKRKKIAKGYQYKGKKQTITVAVPDGAGVSWKSSDPTIVDAAWSGKWNGNTIKLTLEGHRRGNATVTLANSKTKKKVKIKVTVGGYGLGFKWGNPKKKQYSKASGKTGAYYLNNFKLINKTGKTVKLDRNCAVRVWATFKNFDDMYDAWLDGWDVDAYDSLEDYAAVVPEPDQYYYKNQPTTIRGLPVSVKKNKTKTVFIGQDIANLNSFDGNGTSWDSGILTVKVGKSYKTLYVDEYGMVYKVLNGRKI